MRSFIATDPSNHQSENTWFTPKEFIDNLGPFDLDPCTMSFRPYNTASRHIEFDMGGGVDFQNLEKTGNAGTGSCLVFYDEKYIDKVKSFQGVLI